MTFLLGSFTIGYPFLISAALAFGRPRLMAAIIGIVLLVPGALAWRARRRREALYRLAEVVLLALFLAVAAIVNEAHVFRLGPALANVAMLVSFGRTLLSGPSMAESIARIRRRDLPREAVGYCRRLTLLWCVFFGLNAAFITWLAFYASLASWMIYTGVVAYLLAGGFLMAELVYRHWRFANFAG
jgi:uncharacterized membrane protein